MRAEAVATSALRALRAHPGAAILLVATGAAALAALLPVASLVAPDGARGLSRIGLSPLRGTDIGVVLSPMAQTPTELRRAAVSELFRLLLGAAAAVLGVAWLTSLAVAGARASARRAEIAVARAVGASRRHLAAAELLQGSLIAVAVLAAGGALGFLLARLAITGWPGELAAGGAAASVAVAVLVAGGILVGALLPLGYARPGARIAGVEATPLALVVPVLQLGLALTVLAAGALIGGGRRHAAPRAAPVASTDRIYQVAAPGLRPVERSRAYAALLRALGGGGERGVEVASLSSPDLSLGLGDVSTVATDCGECAWGGIYAPWHTLFAAHYLVSADSFTMLGLRVVAGRGITSADRWDTARVAVVSRGMAARHFDARGPLGRPIIVGRGPDALYTVVGVVEDRTPSGLGGSFEPRDAVYLSVLQHPAPEVDLTVRGRPGAHLDDAVHGALLATLGPGSAGAPHRAVAEVLAADAAPLVWFARMFGAEGWALLALATAGTFATMWLWVASLRCELGARRAVGARQRDVTGYVLARALLVALAGAAFGSWLGMMVWDALRSVVPGLPAWDPGAVLRYALLLAAAALAGAFLPARRAARAAPASLLAG